MLVIGRRTGEEIIIGGKITISVLAISHGRVKLGLTAPTEVKVLRKECLTRLRRPSPSRNKRNNVDE